MAELSKANFSICEAANGKEQEDLSSATGTPPLSEASVTHFFRNSVEQMHQRIKNDYYYTGTTFVGAAVTEEGNIVTAHLGDSAALRIIYDPVTQEVDIKRLTQDHKPKHEADYRYGVVQRGTKLFVKNQFGDIINMTHALGAKEFDDVLSRTPDINTDSMEELKQAFDRGKKGASFSYQ